MTKGRSVSTAGAPHGRRRNGLVRFGRWLRYRFVVPVKRSRHPPQYTARGVAVGLFWAMTPTVGIQMMFVLANWLVVRRVCAALGLQCHSRDGVDLGHQFRDRAAVLLHVLCDRTVAARPLGRPHGVRGVHQALGRGHRGRQDDRLPAGRPFRPRMSITTSSSPAGGWRCWSVAPPTRSWPPG